MITAAAMYVAPRLVHLSAVDAAIIVFYFALVLTIGFYLQRRAKTGEDFFMAGREMTAWVAGLSFLSANLGALELMGWAASAYQYGILATHWYWIGAIPAMLFLGLVMMPFYYISKTHSVPGYLRLRFGESSRTLAAISFAFMTVLMSGINMYSMALVMKVVLGWNINFSIWVSSLTVAVYVALGGLRSAIFNEVLQFILIWAGALFKMLVPFIVMLPGLLGLAVLPMKLTGETMAVATGGHSYNEVLPLMLARYCGPGLLGLGITALIAGFMSGMAGNVSAFTTVWTYDIYRALINKGGSDHHYVNMGRWCTILGVLISVGTAYLVMQFASIMDYVQALFSFFVAPLFGTVVLGMLWKRASGPGGFWGLLAGTLSSIGMWAWVTADHSALRYVALSANARDMAENMYRALWSWIICVLVTVVVSYMTHPKPVSELEGLVYGVTAIPHEAEVPIYHRPAFWAVVVGAVFVVLNILVW